MHGAGTPVKVSLASHAYTLFKSYAEIRIRFGTAYRRCKLLMSHATVALLHSYESRTVAARAFVFLPLAVGLDACPGPQPHRLVGVW